ncbi:UNVERIFIED_CONTAM: hypothetical protein K2H54_048978 [Gekko kuhli]
MEDPKDDRIVTAIKGKGPFPWEVTRRSGLGLFRVHRTDVPWSHSRSPVEMLPVPDEDPSCAKGEVHHHPLQAIAEEEPSGCLPGSL